MLVPVLIISKCATFVAELAGGRETEVSVGSVLLLGS